MKNYRFYLEYDSPEAKGRGTVKQPGLHRGTVCAANVETGHLDATDRAFKFDGFCGLYREPNSPVYWGELPRAYLRSDCLRIPESLARELHPALFTRLDAEPVQSSPACGRRAARN